MSLILLVLLAVLVLAGFGAALALSGRRQYEEQGEVIPGLASDAPASWAGSHSPEAKMHRRLGEVVRGLRAVASGLEEDMRMIEMRVELEQHALEVDRRLILAAQLPPATRPVALAEVEQAVIAVEEAAGRLAAHALSSSAVDAVGLEDLTARIRIAAETRAELEALEAIGSDAVDGPRISGTTDAAEGSADTADPAVNEEPETDERGGTPQASPG